MSEHQSDSPEPSVNPQDQEFQLGGNRPANNAFLSTPGALNKSWEASDGAADFLGLDAEFGAAEEAPAASVSQNAEIEGADQTWLMKMEESGDALVVSDGEDEDPEEEQEEQEEEEYAEEDPVHASWVEDERPVRARSMLPRVAAGLLVGVLGMTAVYVVRSGGGEVPAGVEVAAAGGEVVALDFPDDRLPDPGLLADLGNGEPSLVTCSRQDLADAHAAPPLTSVLRRLPGLWAGAGHNP